MDARKGFLRLPIIPSYASNENSNSESNSHPFYQGGEQEPLDLTVSTRVDGKRSCSDCKELRREVREVRNSVQFLIQQFSDFAGRWSSAIDSKQPAVSSGSSVQRCSPVSSVSSVDIESCLKEDSEKRRDISPESAASSVDSVGNHARKRKSSKVQNNKKDVSRESTESALPSLKIKDITDTPIIPEIKRPKTETTETETSTPAYPITTYAAPQIAPTVGSHTSQPNLQLPLLWNAGWNPLLRQAYDSPEFRRHVDSSVIKSCSIPGMGSPSPPSSGGRIPSPSASSGLSQVQLEAVIKNVVAMQQQKRDIEAQKYHQQMAAGREEIPLAADITSMRAAEKGVKSPESPHQTLPIKKVYSRTCV